MNKVTVSETTMPIAAQPGRVYRLKGRSTCFLYVREFGAFNGGFFVNLSTGLQCNPEVAFVVVEEIQGAVTIEPE